MPRVIVSAPLTMLVLGGYLDMATNAEYAVRDLLMG